MTVEPALLERRYNFGFSESRHFSDHVPLAYRGGGF
jgi:hypothetical protein